MIFMFETLAVLAGDELSTMYGLLAEEMQVAPDRVVDHVSPESEGALLQRRPGYRRRRQAFVRHADEHARRTRPCALALAGVARAIVIDRWHDPLRPARSARRRDRQPRHAPAGVLAQVGAGRRRQAEACSTRSSPSTRSRAARTRSRWPTRVGVSNSVATTNYWARDLGVAARLLQLRPRRLPATTRTAPSRSRRSRPASSTCCSEYSARTLGAPARGAEVATTAGSSSRTFPNGFGSGLQSYELNLRRPKFQDIRVREALALAYDFEAVNRYQQYKRANSVFSTSRVRRRAACPRPASWSCSSRTASRCRPRCSARRASRRAPIPGRSACARTCSRRARCSRRPAGRSPPTACCAMRRASRSSSSTCEDIGGGGRAVAVCSATSRSSAFA